MIKFFKIFSHEIVSDKSWNISVYPLKTEQVQKIISNPFWEAIERKITWAYHETFDISIALPSPVFASNVETVSLNSIRSYDGINACALPFNDWPCNVHESTTQCHATGERNDSIDDNNHFEKHLKKLNLLRKSFSI